MSQQYSSYARPPGVQSAGKYPQTGPNYAIYGEQPGYIYNPWTDRYDPDKRQVEAYQRQNGQLPPEKKTPGTSDLILPLAVVGGTGIAVNELGKGIGETTGNAIFGAKDGTTGGRVGGLFGKTPPTQATTPTLQPAQPAAPAAPAQVAAPTPNPVAPPADSGGMFRGSPSQAQLPTSDGAAPGGMSPAPTSAPATVIPQGQEVPQGYTAVGTSESGGTLAVPSEQVKPDGSVDLGAYAQGALGAYSLYQGYRSYQHGDYAGAAGNTALGAASIGAAAGSSTAAEALPYVGGVVGAYNAYKTHEAIGKMPAGSQRDRAGAVGGATAGAAIGAYGGPVGIAIGAAVGALAGLADSKFGSHKDKYQMIRDEGRKYLQQNGVLDQNYQGTLADGSKYDFGKDGKQSGKLDTKNPLWGQAAAYGNVLASAEGLYGRSREALATLYANAGMSNAKDPNTLIANFQHFAQQRGLTQQAVDAQLQTMLAKKQITQEEFNVFSGDKNRFVPGAPAGQQQPGQAPGPQPLGPGQTPQSVAGAGKMQPLGPGQTPQSVANAATGQSIDPGYQKPVGGMLGRSRTRSPGIGNDGQRIRY